MPIPVGVSAIILGPFALSVEVHNLVIMSWTFVTKNHSEGILARFPSRYYIHTVHGPAPYGLTKNNTTNIKSNLVESDLQKKKKGFSVDGIYKHIADVAQIILTLAWPFAAVVGPSEVAQQKTYTACDPSSYKEHQYMRTSSYNSPCSDVFARPYLTRIDPVLGQLQQFA